MEPDRNTIGPGVTGWSKGDRVLVDPINRVEGGLMGETVHGGLAELCKARAHQPARLALICSLSLVGILLLRYFILYAGQMTVM